ncbi:MAG: hypothetical protein Hyperionvirus34_3 [Hyperionvirus sp.]|uniref:Uncharacterized protein n=1 Tax=Hyperionvirus sp. TaxID=2487770 RepID=A0A3G5AH02_9VIRU|nr:MAG: hypothetical protein Hyperionvirus34_3 [Hyperionvirus sp.]
MAQPAESKSRYALILVSKLFDAKILLDIVEPVGKVKKVLTSEGIECCYTFVEFMERVNVAAIDRTDKNIINIKSCSPEEWEYLSEPSFALDFAKWRYGSAAYESALNNFVLVPVPEDDFKLDRYGTPDIRCSLCTKIANDNAAYYILDKQREYILCSASENCIDKLLSLFEKHRIIIPKTKITEHIVAIVKP